MTELLLEKHWKCCTCKEVKPASEFHKNSKGRSRPVQSACKGCQRERGRTQLRKEQAQAWKERNREKLNAWHRDYYHAKTKHNETAMEARNEYARWRRRLKKYGVTKDMYESMMVKQDGKCAICKDEQWLELRVDHDHNTGAVRELLCAGCNAGIGLLRESPSVMRAAIQYVKRHGGDTP